MVLRSCIEFVSGGVKLAATDDVGNIHELPQSEAVPARSSVSGRLKILWPRRNPILASFTCRTWPPGIRLERESELCLLTL